MVSAITQNRQSTRLSCESSTWVQRPVGSGQVEPRPRSVPASPVQSRTSFLVARVRSLPSCATRSPLRQVLEAAQRTICLPRFLAKLPATRATLDLQFSTPAVPGLGSQSTKAAARTKAEETASERYLRRTIIILLRPFASGRCEKADPSPPVVRVYKSLGGRARDKIAFARERASRGSSDPIPPGRGEFPVYRGPLGRDSKPLASLCDFIGQEFLEETAVLLGNGLASRRVDSCRRELADVTLFARDPEEGHHLE